MPAGKSSDSNAMLYTLITFVALFIIAATAAVIFYVKAEEYRTQKQNADSRVQQLATTSEQSKITQLVGDVQGQSVVGACTGMIDELVRIITGEAAEDVNAAEKVNNAKIAINKAIEAIGPEDIAYTAGEIGNIDLVEQMLALDAKMEKARADAQNAAQQLALVQDQLVTVQRNFGEHEADLQAELDRYQKMAQDLETQYNDLQGQMRQSTDEQIQNVQDKLVAARQQIGEKNQELEALQARLDETQQNLQTALDRLEAIKPRPNVEVAAFQPDAKIVRVDQQRGVVYLNVGSDDHVYTGLTFSVYDKNAPIPEDGQGKAEIEVFNVQKTVSAAKINRMTTNNPVVPEDIVANLIWDTNASNKFVVAGEFDFNRDGRVESNGAERLKALIQRWGGQLQDRVNVETDFVVVGDPPQTMTRPTVDELDMDPSLQQKYETSIRILDEYNQILAEASTYGIPVFNQKRLMYLIGYDSLAGSSPPVTSRVNY